MSDNTKNVDIDEYAVNAAAWFLFEKLTSFNSADRYIPTWFIHWLFANAKIVARKLIRTYLEEIGKRSTNV